MFSCALFLALAAGAPQPADAAARQHVERGYALAQRGDLKAAEGELREAVRRAPDDALALAVLGMVLSQPPRLEEANRYLERALELDPADVNTRYNLAYNQFRLGRLQAARANLERILKQQPEHQRAAALLAAVRAKGGYDEALAEFQAGRFAASQQILERLVAAGSGDARILTLAAWCHHRQNRPDQAMAALWRAIELAPADPFPYRNAAHILLEQRNFKAAYASVTKALELAPQDAASLKLKGLLEIEYGDFKQARAALQRAVELDASDGEALEKLGEAQRLLFQYAEAATTFEKGITRFPRQASMYQAYGILLLDPGARPDQAAESRAVALLEKALTLDSRLPQAHFALGKYLLEEGRATAALPHLEAAARLNPQYGPAHLALAGAYKILSRPAEEARELQRFRDLEMRRPP